ncbi:GSCOCG00005942001-RA-CDS [Cotesia congregata]|nr:GSCOCG00005942001-RA-CDS [Cotesia congregata]
MSDNIKVAIKVRPLIKREKDDRLAEHWITENNCIQQIDPESKKRAEARFHFDYIFGTEANNQDVFDQTVKPIVEAAMNGFNGTIFAYGQTGSGKTYTMMGNKEQPGVIPLTVNYIFNYILNDSTRKYLLRVSYIEIYNEKVNDLLDKNNQDLKVKEDYQGRINVDCKEEVINSPECVLHAMRKGEKLRRIGETNMNERSSRSHTIFRFTIESCRVDDPDGATTEAQLNLIDLAGSERARQTGATGERFNEGKHINLSLSALALVIKQLSEPGTSFINYRDSKLTRILQPSLGGNALTTIICAVTPAAIDETQCTLDFAVRAKGIKNKPQVNETVSERALLKRMMKHQAQLEAALESAQTKLAENEKYMLLQRIELLSKAIVSKPISEDEKVKARRRRTWAPGNPVKNFMNKSLDFGLPTITELSADSPPVKLRINDQDVDLIDLNNQCKYLIKINFYLQLIKDQNEKNRFSTVSDDGEIMPTVTAREQVSEDEDKTPEASPTKCPCIRSPSTPKVELRKRLAVLKSEYSELREFSTLEKQLYQEDANYERELEYYKKSLQDSEQVCMDLRKNYAELQSEHAILAENHSQVQRECEKLNEEKKSLEALRDHFPSVEAEKNEYKNKMNEALKKIKILEDEANSNAYELELLTAKHKKREKELEDSLNLAWKDFIDPSEKQKLIDVVHLQSLVNELTAKLESQPSPVTSSNNEEFITKLTELESQLQRSAEEKHHLADQLEELSIHLTQLSEAKAVSSNEHELLVTDFEKRIAELEETIASKATEYDELLVKNVELADKLAEKIKQIESNELEIDKMKISVDNLQADIEKKAAEILSLKTCVEKLDVMKEEIFTSNDLIQDVEEEFKLMLASQDSQESLGNALDTSFKSVIEMPGDEEPNLLDALVEEQKNRIAELELLLEDQRNELLKQEKLLEDKSNELKVSIESHTNKISELQATNDKLKEQLSTMQSEKTLNEGERNAMQLLLKERDQELQELTKTKNQLAFMTSQNQELEKITTDLRKQLNEKVLELEEKQRHDHESEIKNLKDYITNLQNLYKDVQVENENLKQQADKINSSLKIDIVDVSEDHEVLRHSLDSSVVSPLEKTWTADLETTLNDSKNACKISAVKPFKEPKPLEETPVKINKNSAQDDKLKNNLQAKIDEIDAINRDMMDFKSGMESLEETVHALTTENEETSTKLEASNNALSEMEIKYKQMINDLETEIQMMVKDKKSMEKMLKNNEAKIKELITENMELTNDLTDRIDELNKIQEMKALEFDHDCKYRDQFNYYIQKNEILQKENIDLANKHAALFDENSALKEAYAELATNPNAEKLNLTDLENTKELLSAISPIRSEKRSTSPSPSLDRSIHDILDQYDENETLLEKIRDLENQNEELKILNKKLTNIKLTSCKNCAHLAELNEQRRTMKREIITMNQRTRDLKEKFKKEQAVVEILTNKAKEDVDINTSVCNATMNDIYEDVSVSYAEEEIQKISSELESIRGDYQKLSSLYEEKCSDTDELRNGTDKVVSPRSNKRNAKFEKIEKELQIYKDDLQQTNKRIFSIDKKLNKFINAKTSTKKEVESLKAVKEMLEEKLTETENSAMEAQRRINQLEEQVGSLTQKLEQAGIDNKDLHEVTKGLESQIIDLKKAKEDYEQTCNELRSLLAEVEGKNLALQSQVEALKAADAEKSPLKIELDKYKQDMNSFEIEVQKLRVSLTAIIDEYKQKVESLEISVKDLREKVDHYARENVELADKLATLQKLKRDLDITDNKMEVCDESFSGDNNNKVAEELETLRSRLIKEISALKPSNELMSLESKTVSEIFLVFLEALLSKEKEIVHLINRRSAQEKNKLEEEKKELIDAEKRVSKWAKELEADNERLQSDLTKHENKISLLQKKISQLESSLMDSEHEKQLLNEKMTVMETDFNTLQQDYDRIAQSGVSSSPQEREKLIQEALESREAEHKIKLKEVEQKYNDRLKELESMLECCRTQNADLAKNLEGLELNDQQWKNIIDMKTIELNKSNSTIQRLQTELANLTELYDHIKEDNQSKGRKIEEITELLKMKCDKSSEYKTQLETIIPEYELLKQQAAERQVRLEQYKSEVDNLRGQNSQQVALLKDQLDAEQIKAAGLVKQLAEVTNRCTANQVALDQLKEKCEELEQQNERLIRKVRNSTSKVTVDREIEAMKDENRKLSNDLEGACNRIKDLQNSKSQLMTEFVELKGQYELTCQEMNLLQVTLSNYKLKINSSETLELRSKYDALIMEKNLVALELEEKRSTVLQYEKKMAELVNKNEEVMKKNKELDEEMDDMLNKINELDLENTELQDKIYKLEDNNPQREELEMLKRTLEGLKQENADLKAKSELYNQNRPLELADDQINNCDILRQQIKELDAQLVMRNAKITSLEMQIEAGFFPHQKKCDEYTEILKAYKQQNDALRDKLRSQQRAECERCTRLKSNHRELGVQTDAEKNERLRMNSVKYGVIPESLLETKTIAKLQSEKIKLQELLKKSHIKIYEQQNYIKKLENQDEIPKTKNASKENIHVNVLGMSQLTPHRFWYE